MQNDLESKYTNKASHYFEGAREDFVARLPNNKGSRVLEIGCGEGGTGALALSKDKCGEYVGIELVAKVAEKAKGRLTHVYVADVELDFPSFPDAHFDAFIASEVLEHLRDPWDLLKKVRPLLRPGALVLASSPNIAHRRVIKDLRRGEFNYTDIGVMDRTHLRWFTPNSYAQMFRECGFTVEDVWPIQQLRPMHRMLGKLQKNGEHRFWRQICVAARRPE